MGLFVSPNAHRSARHYTKWREAASDWFDGDPQRVQLSPLYPPDAAWAK